MSGARTLAESIPMNANVFGSTRSVTCDEWLDATGLQQARAIRERKISSEELVRGYLARIERHNPALQAFVEVAFRRAPKWAREKDAMTRSRGSLPAFHGVPIGIKDMSLVRGFRARFGARSLRYLWPVLDDYSVRSLRAAGFVILGKLATSEVGAMPVTEPDIHPPTRNPWNYEYSPGGSSGGSAAAVAAGLLPLAHGADGGGSIRIPAALCGLFGFKPSRGRIRNAYGRDDARLIYTCGPITRSVEDAAAMLDVMNNGQRPALAFQRAMLQPVPSLRVRFAEDSPFGKPDPEHIAAMRRVLGLLESMGHAVEQAPLLTGTIEDFLPLWQTLVASAPMRRSLVQPVTGWLIDGARGRTRRSVAELHDRAEAKVDAAFGDADLWVSPTTLVPAPRIGAWRDLPPAAAFTAAAGLGGLTAPFNITGQPACSLPVGLNSLGLPIGVQLVARRGEDGLLLALARNLERALGPQPRAPLA
jgi:amidase